MAWSLSNSEMAEVREAFMELDADKSLAWSWMLKPLGKSRKSAFFFLKKQLCVVSFQKKGGGSGCCWWWISRLHGEMLLETCEVFFLFCVFGLFVDDGQVDLCFLLVANGSELFLYDLFDCRDGFFCPRKDS